jgi:hypothetical protein
MTIQYQLFPRSIPMSVRLKQIVNCFEEIETQIRSADYQLPSNSVLELLRKHLELIEIKVEQGKTKAGKINVPVLFGLNDKVDKSFHADAVSLDGKIVIEVEAGRAVDNNQFLKDIFQACMMFGVEYLVLAVRNHYRQQQDFQEVYKFLELLYISNRLILPLQGIMLIGY